MLAEGRGLVLCSRCRGRRLSCVGEKVNNVARMNSYALEPIGFIRSTVKGRADAPPQGPEGAPDAWLEIEPRFVEALLGWKSVTN